MANSASCNYDRFGKIAAGAWFSLLLLTGFAQQPAETGPLLEFDRLPPDKIGPQNQTVGLGVYQVVRYVAQKAGSDRTGDGSARKPWASLSHALSKITDGGSSRRYAILVAAGTYGGATLKMKEYVDLYGGFDAKTWQRDIFRHAIVLDGQGQRRVLIGANNARLDGFIVTRGKIRGHGGAILCNRTSPTISNNRFLANATLEPEGFIHDLLHQEGHEGGAIACLGGAAPLIADSLFAANTTEVGGGGAIACRNQSTPTIIGNVLCYNRTGLTDKKETRSSNGAAISCSNSSAKIINNLILHNRVSGNSDAGGIYCEYDASAIIMYNYLLRNLAEDDRGAIYVMKSSEPTIASNIIAGNKGAGAIRLSKEGRAKIHNNYVFANVTGGVSAVNSWMVLTNNTIAENEGFGVHFSVRLPHVKGCLLANNIIYGNTGQPQISLEASEPPMITHCNISGGYAGNGNFDAAPQFEEDDYTGAAGVKYDAQRFLSTLSVQDARFKPNELRGCVIRVGGRWGVIQSNDSQSIVVWGDLRPDNSDENIVSFQIPITYHLRSGSPCIDKGIAENAPQKDFDGDPRSLQGNSSLSVDVGADEFRQEQGVKAESPAIGKSAVGKDPSPELPNSRPHELPNHPQSAIRNLQFEIEHHVRG